MTEQVVYCTNEACGQTLFGRVAFCPFCGTDARLLFQALLGSMPHIEVEADLQKTEDIQPTTDANAMASASLNATSWGSEAIPQPTGGPDDQSVKRPAKRSAKRSEKRDVADEPAAKTNTVSAQPVSSPSPTPATIPRKSGGIGKWILLMAAIGVGAWYWNSKEDPVLKACQEALAKGEVKLEKLDFSGAKEAVLEAKKVCKNEQLKKNDELRKQITAAEKALQACLRPFNAIAGLLREHKLTAARLALDGLTPFCANTPKTKELLSDWENEFKESQRTETVLRQKIEAKEAQEAKLALNDLLTKHKDHPDLAVFKQQIELIDRAAMAPAPLAPSAPSMASEPKLLQYSVRTEPSGTIPRGSKMSFISTVETQDGSNERVSEVKQDVIYTNLQGQATRTSTRTLTKSAGKYDSSFEINFPPTVAIGQYKIKTVLYINNRQVTTKDVDISVIEGATTGAAAAPTNPPTGNTQTANDRLVNDLLQKAEAALNQQRFDAAKTFVESARSVDSWNPKIGATYQRIRQVEQEYMRNNTTIR